MINRISDSLFYFLDDLVGRHGYAVYGAAAIAFFAVMGPLLFWMGA